MRYIIKFIDGSRLSITEDEYSKLNGRSGLVFIPSSRETINMQSISRIYPAEREAQSIDRSKQCHGMLHDGTPVIRQFGEWFVMNGEKDDHGRYVTRPDLEFYPEVRQCCIPTAEEYESIFKRLPVAEWIDNMLLFDRERPQQLINGRNSTDGFTHI